MRKDQDFPVSIEVQFLGGSGRSERPTGNVCSPGTHIVMDGKLITAALHRVEIQDLQRRPVGHGRGRGSRQWHHQALRQWRARDPVRDARSLTAVTPDAQKLIAERHGEQDALRRLHSLQAESHPVEFRKVEICPLDE